MVGLKWFISSVVFGYQRRNRAGRIGYIFSVLGILGMIQRIFMGTPPGAFGGIPAILFVIGVVFTFIGWLLSIVYPQRRL
jgi:hypothetical protein